MKSRKNKKIKSYKFGIFAEKIVIIFLRLKIYKILAWRLKTPFGEIDILAERFGKLIAIEVKARSSKSLIEEVLRQGQVNRIKKSLEFFIAKNKKFQNHNLRFDFVEVSKLGLPKHYKNFF